MDVFISHSHEDAPLAAKLEKALRGRNIEAWSTQDGNLKWGDNWKTQIEEELDKVDAFILILSPANLESSKKPEEWRDILRNDWESTKPLIPIVRSKDLRENKIPAFLRNRQFLSTENFDELLERVLYLLYHPSEIRDRQRDQEGRQDQIHRLEELKQFALALKDNADQSENGAEYQ